jgi:ComF family protein
MGKAEAVRLALDALVGVTLAPVCAGCARVLERPLDGPVCAACWDDVARNRGAYDGALRQIIQAFKYDGRRSLGRRLGEVMRSSSDRILQDAACAIPVPLHPWRQFRRGFNQAADLAAHLGLPVVHALWRVRATPPQFGLSAAERRRNVRRAFVLSKLLSSQARRQHIEGRIVVLVDDVRTTGATLGECADVLLAAGARDVRPLTLARAELDRAR